MKADNGVEILTNEDMVIELRDHQIKRSIWARIVYKPWKKFKTVGRLVPDPGYLVVEGGVVGPGTTIVAHPVTAEKLLKQFKIEVKEEGPKWVHKK